MAVSRGATSSLVQGLPKYRSMLGGNSAYSPTGFYSIASFTATGSETTTTFSAIPQTYSHLQIRLNLSGSRYNSPQLQINGDTVSTYPSHGIFGREGTNTGAYGNTSTTSYYLSYAANTPLTYPWVGITDILDYTANKNKTMKSLVGGSNNTSTGYNGVEVNSGVWLNTAAITSLTIFGMTFAAGSKISLYGVK